MKIYKTSNNTSFLDLLFNCLLGFVFLFTLAFLLIQDEKNKAQIKSKAEYVINVTWPNNYKSDVDTWLKDPLGNVLWYRQKDIGLMHLDRDDLGHDNDVISMADGSTMICPINQEISTIRGFIPGEWILNIHLYQQKHAEKIPVIVELSKLNPSVKIILSKKFILEQNWQETTVLRFTMTGAGEILDTNDLFVSLISEQAVGTTTSSSIQEDWR